MDHHEQQNHHQPHDQDQDLDIKINDQNIILNTQIDNQDNLDLDQDCDDLDQEVLDYEAGPFYCTDNNPPDSYSICETKVAEWLNHNTFMERKASVKFACAKHLDPCQTRASRRSVSLNQKAKLSIIGFRKKPVHHQGDHGKSKHNEKVENKNNVRLFRNRSEPGRDYCLLITEPVSPRVSCVGRVGSVRVQGRKAGVWRSFKAAFSNMVQAK